MTAPASYAATLRTLGQAIDLWRLDDFELQNYEGSFFVRGRGKPSRQKSSLFQAPFARWRSEDSKPLELRFTPDDIARLEQEGQERRRDPNGMPDFYSLSQLLRTIGAYIDGRRVQLRKLCRRGTRFILEFDGPQDQANSEEHTTSSFYNLFVHRYLRRSNRAAAQ